MPISPLTFSIPSSLSVPARSYMALYSMIQFGCCIMLYFKSANLGNYQFLYQDMMLVFPIVVLMGETLANPELSRKRPSGNLLSMQNLTSVAVHIMLCLGTQIVAFSQLPGIPEYRVLRNDNFGARLMEVTTLYYLSNFQYLLCATLFRFVHSSEFCASSAGVVDASESSLPCFLTRANLIFLASSPPFPPPPSASQQRLGLEVASHAQQGPLHMAARRLLVQPLPPLRHLRGGGPGIGRHMAPLLAHL